MSSKTEWESVWLNRCLRGEVTGHERAGTALVLRRVWSVKPLPPALTSDTAEQRMVSGIGL